MGQVKKILLHTTVYATGIGASKGVALLLVPLYTRTMQPATFATWDLCTATVLFLVPLIELGMASSLARFYIYFDQDERKRAVIQTTFGIVLVAVPVCTCLVFFFAAPISQLVFGHTSGILMVRLVALIGACTVLGNQPLSVLRAQERIFMFTATNFVRALVGPVVIIVLVVKYKMGVIGILYGDLAGLAAMMLFGWVICRRLLIPRIHLGLLKTLFSFGIPLMPVSIATVIVLVSDRYSLRKLVGLEEMAVFSLGFKVAMIMALVTQALHTAWPPIAFKMAKEEDGRRLLARTFRALVLGLSMMGLLLSAFSPELVSIFAPVNTYGGAYRIVPWIVFSYALQATVLIMMTNLVISNKTILATVIVCCGAALKLTLNGILIRHFGIMGAAAATLASYILEVILAYVFTQIVYPVPYELRKLLLLAALLSFAVIAVQWAFMLGVLPGIAVRLAILAAFGSAIIITRIITQEELHNSVHSLKSLAGRIGLVSTNTG